MEQPNRLEMLKEIVKNDPNDDFSRYGLALEYHKAGDTEKAFAQFEELIQRHPDYVPAYFMYGQYLVEADREDDAVKRLQEGIEAAKRTGDQHALAEMQEYLESIQ